MSFDSSSGHLTEYGNTVELFIASDNENFQIDFMINELENAKTQFEYHTSSGICSRNETRESVKLFFSL